MIPIKVLHLNGRGRPGGADTSGCSLDVLCMHLLAANESKHGEKVTTFGPDLFRAHVIDRLRGFEVLCVMKLRGEKNEKIENHQLDVLVFSLSRLLVSRLAAE